MEWKGTNDDKRALRDDAERHGPRERGEAAPVRTLTRMRHFPL